MIPRFTHDCPYCRLFAISDVGDGVIDETLDWYVCDRGSYPGERTIVWRRGDRPEDDGSCQIRTSKTHIPHRLMQALRLGLVLTEREANDQLRVILGLATTMI